MIRYLMLDDEAGADAPAEDYGEALERAAHGELEIIVERPTELAETLARIAELKPDGLLLDVELTNALTRDRQPLAFDGISLAQQVRTLQTRARSARADRGLPEFPIVRLSKRAVVSEYVSSDTTSDDLFDEMIDKDVVVDDSENASRRLLSLGIDYPKVTRHIDDLMEEEVVADLLACPVELLARLDARALLGLRRIGAPAHVVARYVVAALLGRPGPLIDEELLAVRMGVDRSKSSGWGALLAGVGGAAYQGVFASGYARFWLPLFLDWWQREVDDDRPPFRLSAEERVEALRARTGIAELMPLMGSLASPGSRFWHLCRRSGRPVDPAAGFPLLPVYGMETWQDVEYLSLEEARRDARNPRLAKAERARLASLSKG